MLDVCMVGQASEHQARTHGVRAPHPPPPLPPSPRYHASTSTSCCSAPRHIRVGGLTQPNEATQGTRWADRRPTDSMYCLHGVRRLRCIQNTETADLAAIAFSDAIIACLLARTFNANVDGCFQTLHDGMTRWLGHSGWHEAREKSMATWARWAKNGRPLEGNAARTPQEKADENEMAEEEVSTASSLLYTNKPLGQSRYKDSTQDKTPTYAPFLQISFIFCCSHFPWAHPFCCPRSPLLILESPWKVGIAQHASMHVLNSRSTRHGRGVDGRLQKSCLSFSHSVLKFLD
ncbi:hypothetical protein IWZ00DRAFT_111478 [Phyllosticta capitalensis]